MPELNPLESAHGPQTIVVTGGSNGIGYFVSEQLARAGHTVIIAARHADRAQAAINSIQGLVPGAKLQFQKLDLGSFDSIHRAAEELSQAGPLHAVVANAGVVHGHDAPSTQDGYELFFGTNHLGHFALLAQLFPALRAVPEARIVHLGSLSYFAATPTTGQVGQRGWFSNYRNSKLAVMQFGFELDRRLRANEIDMLSVVAHPGNSPSSYTPDRPGLSLSAPMNPLLKALGARFCQGKDEGALPVVHAAVGKDVVGGSFWGPDQAFGMVGHPVRAKVAALAQDPYAASKLWQLSAELTGVDFSF